MNFKTQLTNVEQIDMNPSLLEVYPNPAKESLTIKSDNHQIKSIQLINSLGQSVSYILNPSGITIVPISFFTPGLLILKANSVDGKVLFKKLIKE